MASASRLWASGVDLGTLGVNFKYLGIDFGFLGVDFMFWESICAKAGGISGMTHITFFLHFCTINPLIKYFIISLKNQKTDGFFVVKGILVKFSKRD